METTPLLRQVLQRRFWPPDWEQPRLRPPRLLLQVLEMLAQGSHSLNLVPPVRILSSQTGNLC